MDTKEIALSLRGGKGRSLTEQELHDLMCGVLDARQYRYLDAIYAPGMPTKELTFKALSRDLDQLKNCLMKMAIGEGNADQPLRRLAAILADTNTRKKDQWDWLDHFYRIEHDRDEFYERAFEVNRGQSRFEKMADSLSGYDLDTRMILAGRMMSAVDAMRTELRKPGHGGAKRDARRHIPKIQLLAKHFIEATGQAPSATDDSLFSEYVKFALRMDQSPRKHIENALR